jgi:hypothetical protein
MPYSDAQLQLIKAEIDADPAGVGYSALGSDSQIADAMNEIRAEDLPEHPQIRRGIVPSYDVLARLNYVEVEALTAAARQALNLMMLSPQIDLSADNIRGSLARWFTATGAGSTRQMMGEFQDRDASRSEIVLNEAGLTVSHTDIAYARAWPGQP